MDLSLPQEDGDQPGLSSQAVQNPGYNVISQDDIQRFEANAEGPQSIQGQPEAKCGSYVLQSEFPQCALEGATSSEGARSRLRRLRETAEQREARLKVQRINNRRRQAAQKESYQSGVLSLEGLRSRLRRFRETFEQSEAQRVIDRRRRTAQLKYQEYLRSGALSEEGLRTRARRLLVAPEQRRARLETQSVSIHQRCFAYSGSEQPSTNGEQEAVYKCQSLTPDLPRRNNTDKVRAVSEENQSQRTLADILSDTAPVSWSTPNISSDVNGTSAKLSRHVEGHLEPSSPDPLSGRHRDRNDAHSVTERDCSYAVVVVRNAAEKERLLHCLKDYGFEDVMWLNNLCDHPDVKASCVATGSLDPEHCSDFDNAEAYNVGEVELQELPAVDPMDNASWATSPADSAAAAGCYDKEDRVERVRVNCPLPVIQDLSESLDSLNDRDFQRRFRLSRSTFNSLCAELESAEEGAGRVLVSPDAVELNSGSTAIKVSMVLDTLAGDCRPVAAPEFDEALNVLSAWAEKMICWPDEQEANLINASFFEMTGLSDIIGCIAPLRICIVNGRSRIKRKNAKEELNAELVTDHLMRFRWVSTKLHGHIDDNTVFRRSLLYEQFSGGTRKGRLIGDDTYQSNSFLLTPSAMIRENGLDIKQVSAVVKAHQTVSTALRHLKKQFPILNEAMLPVAMLSKVVVLCTALFNLCRAEGEQLFEEDDQVKELAETEKLEEVSDTNA